MKYLRWEFVDPYYLDIVKNDFMDTCDRFPEQVPMLREYIVKGRIDGRFMSGDYACLKGTLGQLKYGLVGKGRREFSKLKAKLCRDGIKLHEFTDGHAVECFFFDINHGDNPGNSQNCELALEWVNEWLTRQLLSHDTILKVIPATVSTADLEVSYQRRATLSVIDDPYKVLA